MLPTVFRRRDVERHGLDEAVLRRLVRERTLRRVGGWFVGEDVPAEMVEALAGGFRLTCVSAARVHGLWTPLIPGTHVYRPRAANVPDRSGLIGHRLPVMRRWPEDTPMASIPLLLAHAARCLPLRDTAILLESALQLRRLSAPQLEIVLATVPALSRDSLQRVRGDAESGTETAVRWWLEGRRVPVRSQVRIPGVGRVDLLVGRSWVIECDSWAHHSATEGYRRDRAQDLTLRARGFTVTRLTWEQVFLQWEQTEQSLIAVLRRRDHRRAAGEGWR